MLVVARVHVRHATFSVGILGLMLSGGLISYRLDPRLAGRRRGDGCAHCADVSSREFILHPRDGLLSSRTDSFRAECLGD